MGKRRKKGRSVKNNTNVNSEPEELVQAPHTFVIHRGLGGGHVLELTKDFRKVMEPFTATSLKERKKNTIKDFVAIAGLLHVSHLSIFSITELGMYLKICRLPRGPTMTFKVHNFSLSRDVISSLKKQFVVEEAFKHSPLIVLNSFSGEGLHLKMMATMFQNMFPTINLTNVDLNTVRRCVLLDYNPETKLIDFRHYTIKIIPVGISKGVKKVVQGKVPNLARCNDISELLTKSGVLSESEAEDDPSHHVTLSQKIISRGNMESGKSSIKLSELGPRLSLQLIKIEDGLLDGEVLYHDFIEKTEEEKQEIQKRREEKRKLKEKRKKIQEQNKKVKEDVKQDLKEKSLKGMQKNKVESDIIMRNATKDANRAAPVAEDDDAEYYRQEVGEEPDKDLFSSSRTGVKRPRTPHSFNNKRIKLDRDNKNKSSDQDGTRTRNSSRDFKRNDKRFSKGRQSDQGGRGTKKPNKDFKGRGQKFAKGKDKSNSQNRDHRPIGAASGKTQQKRKYRK